MELDIVNEPRITAYFSVGSKLMYTSYDVSCETGSSYIQPCLDKEDMIFLFDADWGTTPETMPNGDTIFGAGKSRLRACLSRGSDRAFPICLQDRMTKPSRTWI